MLGSFAAVLSSIGAAFLVSLEGFSSPLTFVLPDFV